MKTKTWIETLPDGSTKVHTPRFKHDCEACTFLGQDGEVDLYICSNRPIDDVIGPSVIARYSNDGPDYTSTIYHRGTWIDPCSPDAVACHRAGLTIAAFPPLVVRYYDYEFWLKDHKSWLRYQAALAKEKKR